MTQQTLLKIQKPDPEGNNEDAYFQSTPVVHYAFNKVFDENPNDIENHQQYIKDRFNEFKTMDKDEFRREMTENIYDHKPVNSALLAIDDALKQHLEMQDKMDEAQV